MGNNHTPGPWRIGDAGNTVFGPPNGEPAPEIVADLSRTKRRHANARLIAAAPELLEALKKIAEIEYAYKESATFILARAAIAKAEGRNE